MSLSRRALLKLGAAATVGATAAPAAAADPASGETKGKASADYVGVLVDTTLCIGCRKCEESCNRRNHLPRTAEPFADREVLRSYRRPTATAFTVVNAFHGSPSPDQSRLPYTFAKTQCMHCLYPSCVSACIVGALTKARDGAVVYNPTICVGCRYCQIACPFEVPAYEFFEPLAPRVRKCEFCTDRAAGKGANPACAASCPTEALVFGRRADLLEMARHRLKKRPDRYAPHIYGEKEVGGTSWLYLTGRPHEEIALLALPETAPAHRTEAIQHGIFRYYGVIPLTFFGVLNAIMWWNNRRAKAPPARPPEEAPPGAGAPAPGAAPPDPASAPKVAGGEG